MKEFYITSTITVEAENREEVEEMLIREPMLIKPHKIAYALLDNAEIDEAPQEK
jgi:hypothetical protein